MGTEYLRDFRARRLQKSYAIVEPEWQAPHARIFDEKQMFCQLCLRGRHWCETRTAEGFKRRVEYFKNAIRVDPAIRSRVCAASSCSVHPWLYGHCRPQDNFPAARAV